jgi:hypothetical protein
MKQILIAFCFLPGFAKAQELFTYTEPASNMAAKSIGLRLNTTFEKDVDRKTRFMLNPEIMFGISRKVMVHTNVFFANSTRSASNNRFDYNGAGLYLKYRVFSADEVHSHFRLAVFAEAAVSTIMIDQPAISLNGMNTGLETGVIATKLVNKIAVSASAAYVRAFDNKDNKYDFGSKAVHALDYSLSLGKLMLPKEYTDYKQANLNLMLELLGQYNPALKAGYMDVAPSVQLILLSKMRLDAGYRFPVSDDLFRTNPRGFLIRFEYNIFNVYK